MSTDWRTYAIVGLLVALVVGPWVALFAGLVGTVGFFVGRQFEREDAAFRAFVERTREGDDDA